MKAVPVLANVLPFEDISLTSYCAFEATVVVMLNWAPALPTTAPEGVCVQFRAGISTLFTYTWLIVIEAVPAVPVLLNVARIVPGVPVVNCRYVIFPCSVPIKLNVSAPIHAATAMLTATVTAISMMDATTGLRAFLLLRVFIFVLIPPFLGC